MPTLSPTTQLMRPISAKEMQRIQALPHPDLPEQTASNAVFWRAMWIAHCSELAAFNAVYKHMVWQALPNVLGAALVAAREAMTKRVEESFSELVKFGGLLFAWQPEECGVTA
jgi:hypothetical protein